ncbi:Na+/H+ antiporter subunit E [Thermomicrobium sp. 4228-Ro]|uniref:Na+/H+ antiporter subunit E n=1 Tax=Thermomicrobium sp. 4228-Ro TaxID=2993937 RepID=UPI0022497328|nr:Na+/H+ antiporter subunit E [Thermomicrobium sp. 4228-Ro]MCX2728354.1 Na+/H+ antiporter subunit E [Thermomicrobium sp. 4228-Ro]
MNALLLNILLAMVWMMAVGRFTFHQLLLGFLLGFLVVSVVEPLWGSGAYARRVFRFVRFAGFFFWELLLSSLRVAYDIVTPELHARPRIFAVPLDARTDTEVTLVANFLTLTPGTLSLDVSADRRTLYVHTMYAESREQFIAEVKRGLEARLLEVLR